MLRRSDWCVRNLGQDNDEEQQMDLQGIREALHRQPFAPFTIRLVDGRKLPVSHPDFVAVGPRRAIVIGPDNSWMVLEPLLIVSLDYDGKHRSRTNRRKRSNA